MKRRPERVDAAIAKTTVRFPAALHRELRVRAVSKGVSFESLVVDLIQKGLHAERPGSKGRRRG